MPKLPDSVVGLEHVFGLILICNLFGQQGWVWVKQTATKDLRLSAGRFIR